MMNDKTSKRRALALRVTPLLIIGLVLAWFLPWPTSAEYWQVAADGALVFGVRGDSPVHHTRSWQGEGNRLTIHLSAVRPWFGGKTEMWLHDASLRVPDVVIGDDW